METMEILVSLDENYLPHLRVTLASLRVNTPGWVFRVWLLHSGIPQKALDALAAYCEALHSQLRPVKVDAALFEGAPVGGRYPQEMYYRLLAPQLLPDSLNRVLYLDPDTLVINPAAPLWQMEMHGNLFAAAAHTGKTELANSVNKVRLGTQRDYYNSGVLLIDLQLGRREIKPDDVFGYVRECGKALLLPDQDVLNVLYSARVLELDDAVWNYDARNYANYLLRSTGVADVDWVMANTAILHFCGGAKPWKPYYPYRFGMLYKHYMQVAARLLG